MLAEPKWSDVSWEHPEVKTLVACLRSEAEKDARQVLAPGLDAEQTEFYRGRYARFEEMDRRRREACGE